MTTTDPRGSRRRRHRKRLKAAGHRSWAALLLVTTALASCLPDDLGSDRSHESVATANEDADGPIPIAPPPGAIVDTKPGSGWTEGSFSVNDNGAAEYDLPLWVPDARRGHKPSLSLHYNSGGGNGHLGVGWSLTGFSSVTPCSRTINQDGRSENVGFVEADALCLDGRRLRETGPASPSGQREYRTENDNFTRIISYADDATSQPTAFTAWTKDGRILSFGGTTNARKLAYTLVGAQPEEPIFIRPLPQPVTAAWALNRIEDRNGNGIDIIYENLENAGNDWSVEFRPRRILYEPGRQIDFIYEARPDRLDAFLAGQSGSVHSTVDFRLHAIRMSADDLLLREYRLDYVPDTHSTTGSSLLASVTECDGGDPQICLYPVQFEWSRGSYEFDVIDTAIEDVGTTIGNLGFNVMDINGDGYDDLLYAEPDRRWMSRLSNGSDGFGPPLDTGLKAQTSRQPWARPIDYNRDGQSDVLLASHNDATGKTDAVLWRSTGTSLERRQRIEGFYDPEIGSGLFSALFADLDGDGLSDLVIQSS